MHKPVKYVEKAVTVAAKGAWVVFDKINSIHPNPSFTPKWSDKPLLKSYQKSKPPLGWPRSTDSLCPKCVPEIRQQIIDGKLPVEILMHEKAGEIKAQIIERDGHRLLQAPGRGFPRPLHPLVQRRETAPPRHQHGAALPRIGADQRPRQP